MKKALAKKRSSRTKELKAKVANGENPCWESYEPVSGKKPFTRGSCRKKKTAKTQAHSS